MKLIALDVGEKRIGVARADSSTRIAVPVGFVNVDGSEWQELAHIARLHGATCFVIGLPRSNEGNETAQSAYVRNFARVLIEKIPEAKIRFQDESLTSVLAEERLKKRKNRYEKGEIDTEAATIILQDFLDSYREPETKPLEDTNIVKKEKEKAKREMKKATKWISGIAIVLIVAIVAVGGVMLLGKIKEDRDRERAEEFARIEAEMQAEVFDFTIRPGETIREIKDSLIEIGYTSEDIDEALERQYDYSFLKDRPQGASLEGYLFGETHQFYKGVPVSDIIKKYLDGMGEVISDNHLEERYANQGLSLFEGITLASIVQKESPTSEMPTVAQVFLTRLGYDIPLGSDVTVSYALDSVDPNRATYSDNQTALTVESCYNTRVNAGLPCGPISNPGLSALLAVAEPADSAYLYFLTGDDGMMYYSYTESEHIQNIYSHCQELCNVSL